MSPACQEPLLRAEGLTLRHRQGRHLLSDVDFEIAPGEVVLLLGPSGSGKSTLLKLLSGALDSRTGWEASGRCQLPGETLDLAEQKVAAGGIVFQNHALFDELSVGGNLAAAADHGRGADPEIEDFARSLLSGIQEDQMPAHLSGGQQQRVAIARSLLARRPLLFFDEPNAGLDPVQTRRLVHLIDILRRQRSLAVVIVAHHAQELLSLADRVMLLDPEEASLREYAPDAPALADYFHLAKAPPDEAAPGMHHPEPPGFGDGSSGRLKARIRPSWWLTYAGQYLWLLALAPSMLAFIVIGGFLSGFVATWSAFQYMPFADYLLPLVHDDTLTALGLTEARILAPLMLSALIAARNSAIIAADVSHRVYTQQIEAMISLNMSHRAYIAGGVLAGSLLGALILTLLLLAVAASASLLTWQVQFPEQSSAVFREAFFRLVFRNGSWLPDGWVWMLAKILPSALAAGALGLLFGYRRKGSVRAINSAIAQAIIFGVSAALLINALVTLIEPIEV
ncbi:MAG TPA: ATP-binding cassette domain-containing protein [Kiloniellales bacterium]|nr:ATP-binding cassette domain-containing protein [Kiloniellales bacterium]